MSLCMTFLTLCRYSIPLRIWTVMRPMIYSGNLRTSLITLASDPASIYSRAMWTWPSLRNAPYDLTTYSLSHSCSVLSSSSIYFLTFSLDWSGITLSAIIFLVGVCTTFSTYPLAPYPSAPYLMRSESFTSTSSCLLPLSSKLESSINWEGGCFDSSFSEGWCTIVWSDR